MYHGLNWFEPVQALYHTGLLFIGMVRIGLGFKPNHRHHCQRWFQASAARRIFRSNQLLAFSSSFRWWSLDIDPDSQPAPIPLNTIRGSKLTHTADTHLRLAPFTLWLCHSYQGRYIDRFSVKVSLRFAIEWTGLGFDRSYSSSLIT